jgi:hypothetical protein
MLVRERLVRALTMKEVQLTQRIITHLPFLAA